MSRRDSQLSLPGLRELRSAMRSMAEAEANRVANIMANQATVPQPMGTASINPMVHEWKNQFLRLLNRFPYLRPSAQGNVHVEISKVFSTGLITGVWKSNSSLFQVFVQLKAGAGDPAGCNCRESQGRFPCEHNLRLLQTILGELRDPNSRLCQRIESKQFDEGNLDMTVFEYDASLEILSRLDHIVASTLATSAEFDSLPVLEQAEPSRVVWNLEGNRGGFRLTPKIQTATKRGFSKGKKAKLDALYRDNVTLSPADIRVRNLISVESNYYDDKLVLPVGESLFQLIGEPNVQFEGESVSVCLGSGILHLIKEDGRYDFRLDNDASFISAVQGDYFLTASANKKEITVMPGTGSQLDVLNDLFELEPISEKHEAAVLERAIKAQKICSIRLPISVGGQCFTEVVTPLIILRSCKNGSLDYGFRVRDSLGKLHKPGQGIMIHAGQSDGKSIQLERQPNVELELAHNIGKRLNLPVNGLDGCLHDFESAFHLIEALQTLNADVEVLWDKNSEKPMRVLGTISASNVRVGISQKRDWFNLTGECKFGEETLDIATLMQSLRDASSANIQGDFVRVGDSGWARISEKLRKNLKQLDDSVNFERGTMKFDRTSAIALRSAQEYFQFDSTKAWNECLLRLERAEKLDPVLPTGLIASLREYQLEGYKWLRRLAEWGVGGILADDMGLGKTLQTLAVILDRAAEGPSLVIAPTSVGFNWMREVQKFAPKLSATLYRETDREEFLDCVGPNQIVVCSYGLALRDSDKLAKVKWNTMVLDEAQAIKNSRSKTSLAIATIPAKWTVALTGTPVENHLGELWSLFHVVSPGVLGGWDQFRNRFASPIEKNNDEERKSALKSRLTPFILRRTKSEVLKDLPARTEMNLIVELSPPERAIYEKIRMSALGEADSIAKLNDVQDQRFRILALLTRLRQIACHPRMVHDTWTEGSAKLTQLAETLHELQGEGHRVLIFSQFVKHLALIREMLDAEQITYQYLDGSTTPTAREEEVDKFQNGDATAFLISLKAGGTGLNLTAADYVIHMDPWWNPAVEDQATDRAHRIGQDKPVMVYRIVAKDTIEEEILKLHETKRDLVAGILDGTHSAAKLSTKDLIELLRG